MILFRSNSQLLIAVALVLVAILANPLICDASDDTASKEVKSDDITFSLTKITSGLQIPWGLAFLDNQRLLVTERSGHLKLVDIQKNVISDIGGLPPVRSKGQGGLLDIAINQLYKPNDWIYFTYSKQQSGGGATTLARSKLINGKLEQWEDLLVTQSETNTNQHYGSRIEFVGDDIYFTIGDRGVRPNGQLLSTHAGKILRVDLNGKPRSNNPFAQNTKALPEIWSYGHRNPQGISYDVINQRLWSIEHGPRGGDEINLIKPGLNYGWPIVSHGKEYWGPVSVGEATEKEGMENPKKVYIPSIAPSSLLFYSGDKLAAWKGNLFAGALAKTHLNRIVVDTKGAIVKEERLLEELGERIRDVIQGPDQYIYISTDRGNIYQIAPK